MTTRQKQSNQIILMIQKAAFGPLFCCTKKQQMPRDNYCPSTLVMSVFVVSVVSVIVRTLSA